MKCTDRYLACHDYCEKYKEWTDYKNEINYKQKKEKLSYRSYATNKQTQKDRKKNSAKYMRNKF